MKRNINCCGTLSKDVQIIGEAFPYLLSCVVTKICGDDTQSFRLLRRSGQVYHNACKFSIRTLKKEHLHTVILVTFDMRKAISLGRAIHDRRPIKVAGSSVQTNYSMPKGPAHPSRLPGPPGLHHGVSSLQVFRRINTCTHGFFHFP